MLMKPHLVLLVAVSLEVPDELVAVGALDEDQVDAAVVEVGEHAHAERGQVRVARHTHQRQTDVLAFHRAGRLLIGQI